MRRAASTTSVSRRGQPRSDGSPSRPRVATMSPPFRVPNESTGWSEEPAVLVHRPPAGDGNAAMSYFGPATPDFDQPGAPGGRVGANDVG